MIPEVESCPPGLALGLTHLGLLAKARLLPNMSNIKRRRGNPHAGSLACVAVPPVSAPMGGVNGRLQNTVQQVA